MPKATDETGKLAAIDSCTVTVPSSYGSVTLTPYVLPEISESKSVNYADEPIIGRSFPVKTFANSGNRTINMKWHCVMMDDDSKSKAIQQLNAFRSCAYPVTGGGTNAPYAPPPICTISCGYATGADSDGDDVCVVLRSYSVSFPTDVAWDGDNLLPYRFDIDLVWDVVFATQDLPGQDMIIG